MDKLVLENMQFYAYHGVYAAEKKIGQWYRVDMEISADFSKAAAEDDLNAAIDYEKVYKACSAVMDTPSKLIEHVAMRLLRAMFATFEAAQHIRLKLSKPEPPLQGFITSASIEMSRSRGEVH